MNKSTDRMLKFVAPIYEESTFIKSYFDALGVEFDTLARYFSELRAQTHIPSTTWAIEYLERRYSLEPAPHLSLEDRRARLRIKASTHLPLNPAVLEKFARENFGLECCLDESTPGFIRIIANEFPSTANNFVPWLIEEKPAHLALCGRIVKTWYIGDGKVAEPYSISRVEFAPVLPVNDDDKRHFPRLFVGNVNLITGCTELSIAKPPTDFKSQAFAGTVNLLHGHETISVGKPNLTFVNRNFVGQILKLVGNVTIKSDTQPHGDDHDYRSWTSTVYAGTSNLLYGRKVWSLARPKNPVSKTCAGVAQIKTGRITVNDSSKRDLGGKIVVRVGQVLKVVGRITIKPDDSEWHDLPVDGDFFGLRFRFPDATKRIVTLSNPRDDLQKSEIREVGDHAAQSKIVMNSRGLSTTGIDLAMLTTRTVRKIF